MLLFDAKPGARTWWPQMTPPTASPVNVWVVPERQQRHSHPFSNALRRKPCREALQEQTVERLTNVDLAKLKPRVVASHHGSRG